MQDWPFSVRVLAWALQNRLTIQAVQRYVLSYPPGDVKDAIGCPVEGYQALFYAIQRNEVSAVSVILECGANPNAKSEQGKIPVLGFAIFHAEYQVINTVEVVKILLAMGAKPKAVPQDMWEDYLEMPKAIINRNEEVKNPASSWCTPEYRTIIARNLNISLRYFLNKANHLKPPKARVKQVAATHNISLLLTVPYLIVGQNIGTSVALSRLFGHFALNKKSPLVMVFTGPSGHGKTELARQMENLLSCSALVVDCTEMRVEMDLFGWKGAYQSRDQGAPLNNFLGQHSGQRCIVFLDEFEKTSHDVRQALLLVFDTGIYRDRRTNNSLDCSKTIWIIASNLATPEIVQFSRQYLEEKTDTEQLKAPLDKLDTTIKSVFIQNLGAPITGRISVVVPFFPFTKGEQAVVLHKFLLDLRDELRQPINLKEKKVVGHGDLSIQKDGQLCTSLAQKWYDIDTGARSLLRGVEQDVEVPLAERYCMSDAKVSEEMNKGPLQKYTVQLWSVEDSPAKVSVIQDGETVIVHNAPSIS